MGMIYVYIHKWIYKKVRPLDQWIQEEWMGQLSGDTLYCQGLGVRTESLTWEDNILKVLQDVKIEGEMFQRIIIFVITELFFVCVKYKQLRGFVQN